MQPEKGGTPMRTKRLFNPGEAILTFRGECGLVLSEEDWAFARLRLKEGKRAGRFFAVGCCENPDYVTQVPVLFEDRTYDVMRAMNIKRASVTEAGQRKIFEEILAELNPGRKKGAEMEDCIFCKIVNGQIPHFKIYEDRGVLAFADINPISEGHTLVIPKRHAKDLWEISGEDLAAVHLASKKIALALKEGLGATGVACVQLNGKDVNQVVGHFHLHLVPRKPGDPELPVSSWEVRPGNMKEIQGTAEKISAAIR